MNRKRRREQQQLIRVSVKNMTRDQLIDKMIDVSKKMNLGLPDKHIYVIPDKDLREMINSYYRQAVFG